jgi:hypothetical protein
MFKVILVKLLRKKSVKTQLWFYILCVDAGGRQSAFSYMFRPFFRLCLQEKILWVFFENLSKKVKFH